MSDRGEPDDLAPEASEPGPDIEVPGYTGPLSVRYAQPAGPLGY